MDGNIFYSHVLTKFRIHCPERGIDNFYSFNLHSLTTNRLYKRRAEKATLQGVHIIFIRFGINGSRIVLGIPHGLVFVYITHTIIFQVNHDTEKLHPPFLALPIQCTLSFDSYVLGIYRINQRLETFVSSASSPFSQAAKRANSTIKVMLVLFLCKNRNLFFIA